MASLLDGGVAAGVGGGGLLGGGGGGLGGGATGSGGGGHHHQVRIHGGKGGDVDENGVPVFNHANPIEWLHKRAYYEKKVKKSADKKD